MAYADQEMSSRRILAIGFVALLHAGVGYALVTGLAYDAAKAVFEDTKLFDIVPEEPKPPEEPPPPPPKVDLPPPPKMTVPPPVVQTNIQSNNTAPAFTEKAVQAPPPPPRPVEAPPPPPKVAQKAVQKGGSISDDDYPPSAQRNEESGTTTATFTIGPDGKVASCNASGASSTLDAETCKLIIRRFRYKPALGADGQPMSETKSQRVTWRLPK
ncbi:MAG: energy transducer TonB [Chakrabartia sp.]